MEKQIILPRRDLREAAFRKYESFIARACYESFETNPADLHLTRGTFAARFRDAILAKRRYNYPSDKIPQNFDLSHIECHELANGLVLIQNNTLLEAPKKADTGITEDIVVAFMNRIARKELAAPYILTLPSIEQIQLTLTFAAKHPEIDCTVYESSGKVVFTTL